jgi:hypothetical protein
MEITMRIKTPNVFLPENGEHTAILTEVQDLGDQDGPYGIRHMSKLVFALDDTGQEQWWYCKPTLHPASNFYKVAAALLNAVPPAELDSSELIGKSCILITEQYTNQQGKQRSGVKEIKPARGAPPRRSGSPYSQPTFSSKITPENPIDDDDVPF